MLDYKRKISVLGGIKQKDEKDSNEEVAKRSLHFKCWNEIFEDIHMPDMWMQAIAYESPQYRLSCYVWKVFR